MNIFYEQTIVKEIFFVGRCADLKKIYEQALIFFLINHLEEENILRVRKIFRQSLRTEGYQNNV